VAFFPLKVFGPERQYTAFAGEANTGHKNTACHILFAAATGWQLLHNTRFHFDFN
jgi:hypothetical protein